MLFLLWFKLSVTPCCWSFTFPHIHCLTFSEKIKLITCIMLFYPLFWCIIHYCVSRGRVPHRSVHSISHTFWDSYILWITISNFHQMINLKTETVSFLVHIYYWLKINWLNRIILCGRQMFICLLQRKK